VRRLAAVLPTTCAALLLLSAPALAAPSHAKPTAHATHVSHAKPTVKPKPKHKPKPVVHDVTLVGVISDTPTASVAPAPTADTPTVTLTPTSDTSTVTITVQGGDRVSHGQVITLTLDSKTVVRRGDAPATAADLQLGDHVSVRARKTADGSWLATRVNAAAPDAERD